MTIDALAFEPQFLDHLAPVWHALAPQTRGRFLVDVSLVERAGRKGIDAIGVPRPVHRPTHPPPRHDGPPALVASYGDIKEARRLGYGPFAFLEHGAGQTYGRVRNGSYSGGPDRDDNELVLVPSEACARHWANAYPMVRVAVVGCPKIDALPRREPGPGPVVAVSFHWPATGISSYAGTAIGDYLEALRALAARFQVIGHAHPKADWPARMERRYRRLGIPFVADFEDVCRQADVYVCDNSSTIFEFAATGRPVVLLNARAWSRTVELGLRFWIASHVGINVWPNDDLVGAVKLALADGPDQQRDREAALGLVYGLRTNGAASAATAINDWLASKERAAA